ncbi:hypothetical protein ACFVMC_28100 [Nocardia sp. NPDC127579]|uniref:hypothetical protein n=1 Tax=Nocardia sp. NPDC127579 TaxID=3345402 RepID=UPI00362ECF6F
MIGANWGATSAEQEHRYPCDELNPQGIQLDRAITIDAPVSVVFRWLCQLRVAPYSYDLLNNGGKRSPREFTPGLDRLEVGQKFMSMFELVSFEVDRHLTMTASDRITVTYAVSSITGGTRLIIRTRARVPVPAVSGPLLGYGDLVMSRKQLRTLRDLAESTQRAAASEG